MGEKTCLVIGGGRGMGAATAKEMQIGRASCRERV